MKDCFFSSKGGFISGSVHLPVDYVIFISVNAYLKLNEHEKYEAARPNRLN
jgi:pyruvate,water dikinase